jgi:hypothetical protein
MDSLSALPLAGPGVKIEGLLESEPKALRIQLVIQPPSTHRGRHTRAWARHSTLTRAGFRLDQQLVTDDGQTE